MVALKINRNFLMFFEKDELNSHFLIGKEK